MNEQLKNVTDLQQKLKEYEERETSPSRDVLVTN